MRRDDSTRPTKPSIVAFYRGGPDKRGRRLDDILAWDDDELEDRHDYIQTLFPLRTPGVALAPLLDDRTVAAFAADPELRGALLRAFDRMPAFYGFVRDGAAIRRSERFAERAAVWLTAGNHNFLRITRILTCLRELGCADEAAGFPAALEEVNCRQPDVVGSRSMDFWREAMRGEGRESRSADV